MIDKQLVFYLILFNCDDSKVTSIGVSVNHESLATSRAGYTGVYKDGIRIGGVSETRSSQATMSDVSGIITTVELLKATSLDFLLLVNKSTYLEGARVGEHLSVQVVDLTVGSDLKQHS